jgi:phosphoglycolate phosphatase
MSFEIVNPNHEPGRLRVALFDFDGTVSLLRSGWQQIMIELINELVPRVNGEEDADLARVAKDLVYRTNGLPTIFQMQAITDLVRARGGAAVNAVRYKCLFLDRLNERVQPRLAAMESQTVKPEAWQVPGVSKMLKEMCVRGIRCYLSSGSDHSAVRVEIAALGLDEYFAGVFGATADVEGSTKAALFKRLRQVQELKPNEVVTFGDGVEEIRLAKEGGGIAIGIARDETHPERVDPDQRERLLAMGADVIIGDFRVYDLLTKYLFE